MSRSAVSTQVLSPAQLEKLAAKGEKRTAAVGDVLFEVGDERYPFIAILEGEVAVLDPAGEEIIRHQANGFLGELNLMTGQTVFLTAVVTAPLRYIAVDRDVLRPVLFEDGPLGDLLLGAFISRRELLQQRQGIGVEIVGPRVDADTRDLVDRIHRARVPYTWRDEDPGGELPLVRLPGGAEMRGPNYSDVWRALGIGATLPEHSEADLIVVGGGPSGLGAAVYGASEGLDTLVVERAVLGGQAGTSRRIENYLGFPAGISGSELATRAITQARKFGSRLATSYGAVGLEPGDGRHIVRLEGGRSVAARAVVLATGADYRRLPVAGLDEYDGISVFYAAGPPEAQLCAASRVAVVGGGNSAAQAAIWLARGGALVTLLHRRAELRETMSDYLIADLDRFGVAVRDRSEVAELHGADGRLEAVTLRDGARMEVSFLFCFLGAEPCTDWLGGTVARDDDGFVLTGADSASLLETSVPGVFATGDVRAGSIKRVATAVGEGAMVVRLVHGRLSSA